MNKLTLISSLLMVLVSLAASAQDKPLSDEDLTLRPGDSVTWTATGVHRLRFGGSVTHSGKPLTLTAFADVEKLLELNPAMVANPQGVALGAANSKVVGKVRADATSQKVTEFFFTCGFPAHPNLMVTRAFTVVPRKGEPVKNIEIVSANPPKWVLRTAEGDKSLTRP